LYTLNKIKALTKAMSALLADSIEPETFLFSFPKKHNAYKICRLRTSQKDPILIQFPKMSALSLSKCSELEFVGESGYTQKVTEFLKRLDTFVVEHIHSKAEEWFEKQIPLEKLSEMYIPHKSIIKCTNKTDLESVTKEALVEGILQLKYLVFTKETCYFQWEMVTAKVHKKAVKLPKTFLFIEDPDDVSDDEISDDETFTFF
jgi:hypothetical protein